MSLEDGVELVLEGSLSGMLQFWRLTWPSARGVVQNSFACLRSRPLWTAGENGRPAIRTAARRP